MAGTIYRRGQNTFQVRVFLGYDPQTGKRRNHCKTIRGTKKDAEKYLTKILRELHTGTFVEPSRKTVREHLNEWLETTVRSRVRPQTYIDYKNIVRRYLSAASFAGIRLEHLTPAEIRGLYADLQEKGLSARIVRYTHAVLRSALKQAVRDGLLFRNPAELVDLPRQERKEMAVLTPEEARKFLKAAESDRWHALWVLLVTTGIRPAEALALRWSDLDGNVLRVQRTLVRRKGMGWFFAEPKTSKSRRSISLPKSALEALRAHRTRQAKERWDRQVKAQLGEGPEYEDLDLIFAAENGNPLDHQNLSARHFKPLLVKAKVKTVRMYDLRHTSATLGLVNGEHPKVVSERLGHSTINLTMDTYSHVLPEMRKEAADQMERLLFGTGER